VASHLRAFERRLEYLNNQIQDEPKRADFYAEEVRALLWLRDLANEVCSCAPVEEGALQKPCWHCRTHGVLEARRQLDVKKAELAKVRKVAASSGDPVAREILGIIGFVGPVEVNHVG
jgi:adenine-specific DNA methylase